MIRRSFLQGLFGLPVAAALGSPTKAAEPVVMVGTPDGRAGYGRPLGDPSHSHSVTLPDGRVHIGYHGIVDRGLDFDGSAWRLS